MRGFAIALSVLVVACGGAATPTTVVEGPAPAPPTTAPAPAAAAAPATITTTATSATITTTTTTTTTTLPPTTTTLPPTVRILLVGDVVLGRGVSRQVRADPAALFAGVADVIARADIAGANLESPLTTRPHIAANPYALEAPPERAVLLADAGFDVAVIANNHATDAGRVTVLDTIAAVEAVGIAAAGAGPDQPSAFAPLVLEAEGVRVGFVAFDVTFAAWPAAPARPGVAHWDPALAEAAVADAVAVADVVVASIHGGTEYRTEPDTDIADVAASLVGWGADVVWGHGPHVMQPVYAVPSTRGGAAVVATSLGNFIFDQRADGTRTGAVLEVQAGRAGVVAYRTATASHPDGVVVFDGWLEPAGAGPGGWVVVGRALEVSG